MKLTLRNDFHNRTVILRCADYRLSKQQVSRARRELCGIAGCTCGSVAGTRGTQQFLEGTKVVLVAREDGGADVEQYID